MNKLKFFKVIDLIDDDLIKEAEIKQKHITSDNEDEKNITVSGVELYRKNKWQKYALIAAVFLLVAGLGTGGALMFRNRPPMLEDPALPSDISATKRLHHLKRRPTANLQQKQRKKKQ